MLNKVWRSRKQGEERVGGKKMEKTRQAAGQHLFLYQLIQFEVQIIQSKKMDQGVLRSCKQALRKNKYQPVKKLGMGGFGVVFLVSQLGCGDLYSVKCTYKKQFSKKPAMRRYLKQEISLMESIKSPFIVRLHKTFEDENWIFMLMEYCDQGNLNSLQRTKNNGVFSLSESCPIINDLIDGLKDMHKINVVHRDIKPENILQKKERGTIVTKICDLGFSRQVQQDMNTFCGTTYYMAPQIFQKKKYGDKVDIWALGVVLYTMLFNSVPFKSVNMVMEITQKCEYGFNLSLQKIKLNPSISRSEMESLSQLFSLVFVIEPEKRVTLQQFKNILSRCCPISSKKLQQKRTLDSDVSSEDISFTNRDDKISFQLQKVRFINHVQATIHKANFLQAPEYLAVSYYMDKYCLSILSHGRKITGKAEHETYDKTLNKCLTEKQAFQKNLKRCGIPKLIEVYTGVATNIFAEYKEQYRLALGHAFYKAHKCIQSYQNKIRLKLKIFCCHVINRVFQKEYSADIFRHYYDWIKVRQPNNEGKFKMQAFQLWMDEQALQKIAHTVQLLNNKFYRKSGK